MYKKSQIKERVLFNASFADVDGNPDLLGFTSIMIARDSLVHTGHLF